MNFKENKTESKIENEVKVLKDTEELLEEEQLEDVEGGGKCKLHLCWGYSSDSKAN